MSPRTAARLAWGLFGVSLASAATANVLMLLVDHSSTPSDVNDWRATLLALDGLFIFPAVGAVICSSPRRNVIGWLFLAVGLELSVELLIEVYLRYDLFDNPGALPAVQYVAVLEPTTDQLLFLLFPALLLLLFPTGQPPSRRWGALVWAMSILSVAMVPLSILQPGEVEVVGDFLVRNPLGASGGFGDAVERSGQLIILALALGLVLSIVSVGFRYRKAGRVERQQLKWFLYAAAIVAAGPSGVILTGSIDAIFFFAFFAGFLGLPIAAGIAILRYRLYDIDRIINRTLVYGLLTGVLGGGYFGGVILLQLLSRPVTGGSSLAIALTTLLVAAVFQPARRRIQDAVDRRFNRRRYDAARTIEAFSVRLRQQTDLDSLTEELLAVVRETMQPARVSLWLRPPAGAARGGVARLPPEARE